MNMDGAVAAAAGMTIRIPEPNELFLDIDSEEDFELFEDYLLMVEDVIEVDVRPSKSGLPHRHIVVTLNRDIGSDMERCLLQACLGSDRKHELLSYLAILGGDMPSPTLFFEAAT